MRRWTFPPLNVSGKGRTQDFNLLPPLIVIVRQTSVQLRVLHITAAAERPAGPVPPAAPFVVVDLH